MTLPLLASLRRFKHSLISGGCLLVLSGMLLTGTGCSDVITFAGEARQEGIKLYNAGNYPDAAGAFTNAIKQRPQDYESYYYLGRTYEAMKNYHQAVSQFSTTLTVMDASLRGKDDQAFRLKTLDGLANCIAAGNDPSLEQAAFARTNGPTTADDHYVLAKVRSRHGDADSAMVEYAQAATMDQKSLPIAKDYGLYLMQLNQRTKAANELKRAYVLNRRARLPDDEQINSALRQIGITPGPSLGEVGDLAQPIIPTGPLPEVDLSKVRLQNPLQYDDQAATSNAP